MPVFRSRRMADGRLVMVANDGGNKWQKNGQEMRHDIRTVKEHKTVLSMQFNRFNGEQRGAGRREGKRRGAEAGLIGTLHPVYRSLSRGRLGQSHEVMSFRQELLFEVCQLTILRRLVAGSEAYYIKLRVLVLPTVHSSTWWLISSALAYNRSK
jgi:hypothetical protein